MENKTILIQGAMDIEIQYYLEKLKNTEKIDIAGYEFYRGSINESNIIISKTNVGIVNSATATTIGIITFKPDLIINQGIAGSHRSDIHKGDIVIGKACLNINSYSMPIKGKNEGSNPFDWEPNKRANIQYADSHLVRQLKKILSSNDTNNVYSGILGSGDVFSREYDRILWLNTIFGNYCEDMESIGTYSVCNKFSIPCVGVRIISNNELLLEEYDENFAINLQKSLIKLF